MVSLEQRGGTAALKLEVALQTRKGGCRTVSLEQRGGDGCFEIGRGSADEECWLEHGVTGVHGDGSLEIVHMLKSWNVGK